MTLLHDYQGGTSYTRGEAVGRARDPAWARHVALYKSYAEGGAPAVTLARPERLPTSDLWEALRTRRSRRDFTDEAITQESLFLLLWAAQGVTATDGPRALRTAPSAGAKYPIETYVCAAQVDDLQPGLYHWELPEERLAEVEARRDIAAAACRACLDQPMVAQAPATFIWTAAWGRSAEKYGDRALRYAYLDAGHVAENLALAAEALGLGACMIGAFFDDEMNDLVGVDGTGESVLYAACVGHPV
jgi:SagB-type dehydrogenase family enzyme